jgi:peptidoglycan/xylan/chitin deacetylase (PgdA/CDA1 family)
LLEKHSLRAIFFVPASWIGTRDHVMTWSQLRQIVSLRHEVQSHGWSHQLLTHCTESDLRNELERSKRTLEDRLGVPVDALSVPHGRWNRRVLEGCAKAGYKRVYTSDPWLAPRERVGLQLWGRLTVRKTMAVDHFRHALMGTTATLFALRARSVIRELLKHMLGDRLYHTLWRRFAGRLEPSA